MVLGLGYLLSVDPPSPLALIWEKEGKEDLCIETFWELCRFDRKGFFIFEPLDDQPWGLDIRMTTD
jgi:hypothetical protein